MKTKEKKIYGHFANIFNNIAHYVDEEDFVVVVAEVKGVVVVCRVVVVDGLVVVMVVVCLVVVVGLVVVVVVVGLVVVGVVVVGLVDGDKVFSFLGIQGFHENKWLDKFIVKSKCF